MPDRPSDVPAAERAARWHAHILGPVFYPSALIVVALVALSFLAPATSDAVFGAAKAWVANDAGWFTVLTVAGFLVFIIGVAVSGFGRLKLGRTTVRRTTATAAGSRCCSRRAWASG